jgi:FAD:protein FMN transferase
VTKPPDSKPSSPSSPIDSGSDASAQGYRLDHQDGFWRGRFRAMASPCEVLIDGDEHARASAEAVLATVAAEAWRVEHKYSRYRSGNVVHAINTSSGAEIAVDDETAELLDFAERLFSMSHGLFDITSGALRRVWRFDGGSYVPEQAVVAAVLQFVGWSKVRWTRPHLTMPAGMEIDLGGVCKEYAVDRAAALARDHIPDSCLINFGGDLAVSRPRRGGLPWRVGLEGITPGDQTVSGMIDVRQGGVATSGDTYRFVARDGRRFTHILNPRTGYPVENAPRSVTVAAGTCTQAGMLTTLALLQGAGAEQFLKRAGVQYWMRNGS